MRRFTQFAAIDWSGQAVERPSGLALAQVGAGNAAPTLLRPDRGWSRQALLAWLLDHARAGTDMVVGLDLSPALPFADRGAFLPGWPESPGTARALWRLVDTLSLADPHLGAGGFLRHAELARHFRQHRACGDRFEPGRGRLRVCEHEQRAMGLNPTSCFNLIGAAQVGKSSLTGMRVLHRLDGAIPIWPFDPVPARGPLIVEIYTTIAARAAGVRKGLSKVRDAAALDGALAALGSRPHVPLGRYDDHATDAMLTAVWLRRAAGDPTRWRPAALTDVLARTEGWTFGVP